MSRVLAPEILLEEYRQLLQDDRIEALPLTLSGDSMAPFLRGGRDVIYLSRLTRPIRRGDAVLYQRKNGTYVFHRVYIVDKDGFALVGDGQWEPEPGIRPEQIIAIMTAADRKGKRLVPGNPWWEFFEKVWIRMVPLRPMIWKAYSRIRGQRAREKDRS